MKSEINPKGNQTKPAHQSLIFNLKINLTPTESRSHPICNWKNISKYSGFLVILFVVMGCNLIQYNPALPPAVNTQANTGKNSPANQLSTENEKQFPKIIGEFSQKKIDYSPSISTAPKAVGYFRLAYAYTDDRFKNIRVDDKGKDYSGGNDLYADAYKFTTEAEAKAYVAQKISQAVTPEQYNKIHLPKCNPNIEQKPKPDEIIKRLKQQNGNDIYIVWGGEFCTADNSIDSNRTEEAFWTDGVWVYGVYAAPPLGYWKRKKDELGYTAHGRAEEFVTAYLNKIGKPVAAK